MTTKTVRIYTAPKCPFSKRLREYLTEKGVEFTEHNVVTDSVARNEMVQKSGQLGVPVICIDGETLIGFGNMQEKKIAALLEVRNDD